MNDLTIISGLRNVFCGVLVLGLGGCAQVQGVGSYLVERVSGQAPERAITTPSRENKKQNGAAALTPHHMQKLENEKRALADILKATEKAALLVQIEGGDIRLNKTADLPSCQTAQAAISGMPSAEKQAAQRYQSAFSVGSISPYMPHHLLISTCVPLGVIAPL